MRMTPLAPFALVLGLATAAATPAPSAPAAPAAPTKAAVQDVRIVVDKGYQPNVVEVVEGTPIRITFLKKDDSGCTKEVVFPAFDLRKKLPVNEEVVIELPAQMAGELEFHCGMKMVQGKVVVKPKG